MNDDGRGRDEYRIHRQLLPETVQPGCGLDFCQREAGAELGGSEQPSRGQQSWLHLTQQRDGTRLSTDAGASSQNPIADTHATERRSRHERRDEKKVLALGVRQDPGHARTEVGN